LTFKIQPMASHNFFKCIPLLIWVISQSPLHRFLPFLDFWLRPSVLKTFN
jgi:hypothetical protein